MEEAVALFQGLLKDCSRVLGADHPGTLTTRNNLAHWLGESGRVAEAATQFQALLEAQSRVLGEEHPDTLVTRSNLARWGSTSQQAGE